MRAVGFAAVTPNDFAEGSDSDRIEAAITQAVKTGDRSIEIPRMNRKRGQPLWLIERDPAALGFHAGVARLSPAPRAGHPGQPHP